jgi:hypothetical protein
VGLRRDAPRDGETNQLQRRVVVLPPWPCRGPLTVMPAHCRSDIAMVRAG